MGTLAMNNLSVRKWAHSLLWAGRITALGFFAFFVYLFVASIYRLDGPLFGAMGAAPSQGNLILLSSTAVVCALLVFVFSFLKVWLGAAFSWFFWLDFMASLVETQGTVSIMSSLFFIPGLLLIVTWFLSRGNQTHLNVQQIRYKLDHPSGETK